ncbi:hypothetical protein PIB30_088560 [Stylosanthes scabra]|uniref:Transposase n=1 Tax=Stylosanthes scabra TaxID=79078 RepID=A0ABU6VSF9_9FABA|nr:hypothetical protein [Stylosanthes scabra]
MWKYINTKFILPASAKKWVIQTIRDASRRFKTKLKQKHFDPYDNYDDMVKNRPLRVPEDQFVKLLLYWGHPTIQERSQRNKNNRKRQKFPHRMGPVNFARVRASLPNSKGTTEEPQRFEVFIATCTNRKRKEIDEETQTAIEIFQSRQASGETEEEALRSIFGKEQPGQHQEEVTTLRSELGDVKTQQQQQSEEINELRSLVKQLLLRSEPNMRPEEVDAMLQHAHNSPIYANSGHGSHHVRNVSTIRAHTNWQYKYEQSF